VGGVDAPGVAGRLLLGELDALDDFADALDDLGVGHRRALVPPHADLAGVRDDEANLHFARSRWVTLLARAEARLRFALHGARASKHVFGRHLVRSHPRVVAAPVVGPAPASGSPADADAAVVSLGGACSADLGALLPTASSLSFAGGV